MIFAALTAVALVALLVAEARDARPGIWVAKPLASAGFVALALATGALESDYGRLVLGALGFCWLGDVLLIPRGATGFFLAGLASFLVGHALFAVAFATLGLAGGGVAVAAVLGLFGAVAALSWLAPHVRGVMRGPVVAYGVVILTMVVLAAGATGAGASALVLPGAVAFLVSDLAVARQRFIQKAFANKLWGLPLYYAGVSMLAASVGG